MRKNLLFWVLIITLVAGVFVYRNYKEQLLLDRIVQENPVATQQQKDEVKQEALMAPGFTLKDLAGNKVSLQDFKGKIVLLNFWTTWCPSCIIEMPEINSTYSKYKDKGFVVLAVNITAQEKSSKVVEEFIEEKGYGFPVLMDEEGEVSLTYGISSIPTSFIIGPEGEIIDAKVGPFVPMELDNKIKGMLNLE